MDELKGALRNVNRLLKDSQEYKSYIFARNSLKSKEDLYREVMEFKRHYTDVEKYTEGNPYEELYRLYQENDELLHNSTVSEYLKAESAFSKLVKNSCDEMLSGITFE